jgi:Domain of unknown function (DUF4304)
MSGRLEEPTGKGLIGSLVKNYVDPVLSPSGFQRSRLIWNRQLPCMVHVADVQTERSVDKATGSFTMNFGVWIEEVWRICWGEVVPAPVEESDCFPRWRISRVIGSATDVWWTVKSAGDVERTGTELQRFLIEKCIPFMDKVGSIDGLMAVAEDPILRRLPAAVLQYAALKHLRGAPSEAETLLTRYFANPKVSAWQDRVSIVLKRLAVTRPWEPSGVNADKCRPH